MFFGAPGSPEILADSPVWEGRGGNGSCEGLVNLTGDRSEGPLGGHPSQSLLPAPSSVAAPQPGVLTVTSKLCHHRQCPLPEHIPAGVRTEPTVLGVFTQHRVLGCSADRG